MNPGRLFALILAAGGRGRPDWSRRTPPGAIGNLTAASCSGISLIGIIAALVLMGLLSAGVLMIISTATMESALALNWNQAFFAAESGLSATRAYLGANTNWATNTPYIIKGVVGQASFSAVIASNGWVTSTGRRAEAQWTSIWTGRVGAVTGAILVEYTNGSSGGSLSDFPGQKGDCGQSFTTPGHASHVSRIEIEIKKDNPECSDIYMTIRSGSTVGPVLGTSATVLSENLPQSQMEWVAFVFNPSVSLDAGTMYYIRLSSIPTSTDPDGSAQKKIHWAYQHSFGSPPGYAGGDAWLHIGLNNNPSDQGDRLGPADQYDFNFVIYK